MIRLVLDRRAAVFEQDIRELCKSFYPGADFEIHTPEGVHLSETTQEEKNALKTAKERQQETAVNPKSLRHRNAERQKRVLTPEGLKDRDEITLSLEIAGEALPLSGDRRADKSLLKAELYRTLSALSGRELPWGDLTGIRPVSLASPYLTALGAKRPDGMPSQEDIDTVRTAISSEYLLRGEKLVLLMDIALREQRILHRIEEKTGHSYREGFSLYIGIPFCPTRCLYCSFTSNPIALWEERLPDYFNCLRQELRAAMRELCGRQGKYLQTIYIGGGTPTALSAYWLCKLMELVREECIEHPMAELCEFTVEAGRPDSINEEKLCILRNAGVSRISINPQSFEQKTLDLIGRQHSVEQTSDAYRLARSLGFDNINMDIILGLPGERLREVTHTLCEVARRRPDSLTVHSLAVKRAARLTLERERWNQVYRAGGDFTVYPDGSTEMERMMRVSAYTAELLELKPYYLYRQKNMAGNLENVGYARAGKECLYNILMMEEKQTVVGCGAGCSSKFIFPGRDGDPANKRVERCDNGKDIGNYIRRFPELLEKKLRCMSDSAS